MNKVFQTLCKQQLNAIRLVTKFNAATLNDLRNYSWCCRNGNVVACENWLKIRGKKEKERKVLQSRLVARFTVPVSSVTGPFAFHIDSRSLCLGRPQQDKRLQDSGVVTEEWNLSENMAGYIVGHDKSNKMFYITLQAKPENGETALAKLEYDYVRPNLVDLYHTEVPPEFQGQGIAKILAQTAFDHFCEQEIRFRPTCTYLQKYLRTNPVPRKHDCPVTVP
ncbi:uncharacterized protein LOC101856878 isoform X2 [Aplysia californica]|uniref:Protein NATD1 n=1 Tax=Aplysia californica TaxID=6500 RepID=A0ABM1VR02_APLCA|nr:uncharacterized protein LOC101856878 isoform X2 [Aplysia californica]